jgi:hypothetical protein
MRKHPLRVEAVPDPTASPGDLVGALAALLIDRARRALAPRPPAEVAGAVTGGKKTG